MGKIILIMGPSNSGKDTIYKLIKEKLNIPLEEIILYTTRPMRKNEQNAREYYFVNEEEMNNMLNNNLIIERRCYDTVHGKWYYFTSKKEFNLEKYNYIGLNTLVGLDQYLKYFKKENIISLYIEVEKGERLQRAINREKKLENADYEEMCRRFLADSIDFSEEELSKRPITAIIDNNGSLENTMKQVEKILQKTL